ncbi:MAG: hypothetical protein ACLRY7_04630 [Hominenteromicrobium sp.]|uniref:hypothetical protein n=1 Tax=Hominenteromicrobium sp. TaxID=3073581 RepID=UPI0039A0D7F0
MKKKLFAILLSIVMVAGLLPTVAFAEENYNLYVNGEQFTSEKLSIACGEGTASYDPNTKTLTLDNATITNGGKSDESPKYGIRVVGDTDLTIKLSGTNSITLGQHRTIAEASAVESPIRQETIGFPAHFFARAHNFKPPGRACQPEADSPMRT